MASLSSSMASLSMAQCGKEYLIVAAIDFGTTYSGYAYSFRNDFLKDPLKIYTNAQWIDEETNLVTYKAPTSILFDKDEKFSSFGFTAESDYSKLVDDDEDEGWRFFRRFKMNLYREMNDDAQVFGRQRRLVRSLKLRDAHGDSMLAMDIFSAAIRYLKDHFLQVLHNSIKGVSQNDVLWMLTVPAIWSDAAKQFMREAAEQAGIAKHQLTLALEPEAAAIYCKEIQVKSSNEPGQSTGLSTFSPGEHFLLLDIGGGTVDITCHEVQNNGTLKEIHPPTGGPWGGIVVDKAYYHFLQDLVGQEAWDDFTENNPADKLYLESMFEMKKRNVKNGANTIIRVGANFMQSCKNVRKCTLAKTLSGGKSTYSSTVGVKKEKLDIQYSQMMGFFEGPMNAILEELERLFMKRSLTRVKTIIMVGGFSELDEMKEKITSSFPGKDVIRPVDANLAVLKGAVIFGHSPLAICERASPRTYGISVSVPYNDRIHPRKLFHVSEGRQMASDIFQVMVKRGQPVIMGTTKVEHTCSPAHAHDTVATVEVYESTEQTPSYTCDPSSHRLGELHVQIPDTSRGKARRIIVALHFGFTELKVTATEEGTNYKAEAKFDCLNTKA